MSLILTILIDILAAILLFYRTASADQIVSFFSCIIQAVFFIDVLAIMLLRVKPKKNTDNDAVQASRKSRKLLRSPGGAGRTWFIRISVLANLALLIYYGYQFYMLFH